MNEQEAQKTWDEYHEKIKNRRLAQAKIINAELIKSKITSEADLYLDFSFFTQDEEGAKGIQGQLSENYEMTVSKNKDYFIIKGSTKPYVISLDPEQHLSWVEFMHDVALSYRCIFSTWTITDTASNKTWSNEGIETEFD